MGALGLILARSGSKGLPGKNTAPLAGRPCVCWTIDDAKAASRLSRLAVSTDDEAIFEIAAGEGVEALKRPAELATDDAPIDAAARRAVQSLGDESLDPIVLLYANVPARPHDLIDRAVDRLRETGADSVQSYAPVGKHHPWWTARVEARSGAVEPWEGKTLNNGVFRRQDLPPAYVPDGGVLVVSRQALFLEVENAPPGPHAFLGADRRGVINPEGAVVDIDTKIDLHVAEAVLNERAAGVGAEAS